MLVTSISGYKHFLLLNNVLHRLVENIHQLNKKKNNNNNNLSSVNAFNFDKSKVLSSGTELSLGLTTVRKILDGNIVGKGANTDDFSNNVFYSLMNNFSIMSKIPKFKIFSNEKYMLHIYGKLSLKH